jgi:murein DD-endopeptidase / murein LD-carboxypeptidase
MALGVEEVRADYCLRSSDADEANGEFDGHGFIRSAPTEAGDGDVLLVRPRPGQLHVVVLTPGGYLHADMRLRRVAEVPGRVPWPVLSAWRHPERAVETYDRPSPGRSRRREGR